MQLTSEQKKIITAFNAGKSLQVTAGAGTGKTSTLVEVARTCPDTRVLYLAFNKAVQLEAAEKFWRNTRCRTIHSLAYGAVGHRYRARLNGNRIPHAKAASILGIRSAFKAGPSTLQPARLAALAVETVNRYANSADDRIGPQHVPTMPGLDRDAHTRLADYITSIAGCAWDDMSNPDSGALRTSHDVYLKVWALTRPNLGAQVILFDEAQDTTGVTARIVADQQANGTQLVVVGDRAQAIYGWRGAIDAMDAFSTDAQLTLSRSFRFGPAIADLANTWLNYLGQPLRLRGHEPIPSMIAPLATPHAVLCRSNAGAMNEVLHAQLLGRDVAVVGGVIDLERLVRAAGDLKEGRATNHPDLAAFSTWADVEEYAEGGDHEMSTLVNLMAKYPTDQLLAALSRVVDEGKAGSITVSTAHKAKGREWDSVRVSSDFQAPEVGSADPDDEAEAMLAYVAVTRARRHLDPGELVGPASPSTVMAVQDPWAEAANARAAAAPMTGTQARAWT